MKLGKYLFGSRIAGADFSFSSLIVQHAFENLEDSDKSDCVQEVLKSIDVLATDQWGSESLLISYHQV